MKRILNILLKIAMVVAIGVSGYYLHRMWVFGGKVSKSLAYMYSGIECLIMQDGRQEGDINILQKGFKSRKAYFLAVNKEAPGRYSKEDIEKADKHVFYNEDIPACKEFYSQHRCWMFDPHEPKSIDGCGEHFGLTKSEMEELKANTGNKDKINELMDKFYARKYGKEKKGD